MSDARKSKRPTGQPVAVRVFMFFGVVIGCICATYNAKPTSGRGGAELAGHPVGSAIDHPV